MFILVDMENTDNCKQINLFVKFLTRGIGEIKSIKVFTHVDKLAGKKVVDVFAGGDHSWALLDYEDPIILNYENPSPLRSPMIYNNGKSGLS